VEGLGVEVAYRYLQAADLVLYCADVNRPLQSAELAFLDERDPSTVIVVRTKSDLPHEHGAFSSDYMPVHVSSRSGDGLDRLAECLVDAAFGVLPSGVNEAPLITRRRHS